MIIIIIIATIVVRCSISSSVDEKWQKHKWILKKQYNIDKSFSVTHRDI